MATVVVTPGSGTADAFGKTTTFSAQAKNAANEVLAGKTFAWSSSNTAVVTISATGVATAVGNGIAEISATSESVTASVTFTVTQQVSTITVTPGLDSLASLAQTRQMAAEAKDASGNPMPSTTITWSSSSQGVATVSPAGLVTAIANGTTTITASSGNVTATATIVVLQKVATVAVTPSSATLTSIGATQQLAAAPKDAGGATIAGKTVSWASANGSVATVSTSGLVTAVASGSASISASVDGKTGSSAITVTIAPPQNGYWAGFTGQSNLVSFVVNGSQVEKLGVTITAAVSASTDCISRFAGNLAAVPITGGVIKDTVTEAGFTLQGKIAFDGTFTSANALTASVSGFTGIYSVNCGSLFQGNGRLWSPLSAQVRPVVASDADLRFTSLSVEEGHSCGIAEGGAAYCWGSGASGRIGNGSTSGSGTPVAVSGGLAFKDITAGWRFTCGVTTAGAGYCWGDNQYGQLGDGTTTQRTTPVAVGGGLTFASISAGLFHACGLTTTGLAYCWGQDFGRLGLGTSTSNTYTTPQAVTGGRTYTTIDANHNGTCAIATTGLMYCWSGASPTPTQIADGASYSSVAVGPNNTCGVTTGGVLKCWGLNSTGEVGNGTKTSTTTPTQVGTGYATVSAGTNHMCAVTVAGAAYCWGSNTAGRLGVGTLLGEYLTPSAVLGGVTFKGVAAGGVHSCGLATNDVAYCWGYNDARQLGHGNIGGLAEIPMPIRPKYP